MDIFPGEVVGLVGDNGGKSTLVKMVSGYQPDSGSTSTASVNISILRSARHGHRDHLPGLALAGNLDVAANIFLGRERKRQYLGGMIRTLDEKYMQREAQQVLQQLEIHFPSLTQKIDKLSGGQRQAVAIVRAVYWHARLMIMDEPTNNLGVAEQAKVLDLIRRLRDQNVPVLVISHTMLDIFAVSDRIVVLHRGRKVADKRTEDTSTEEIVQYIMGARDDFPQAEEVAAAD